jgi:hypothetical protein
MEITIVDQCSNIKLVSPVYFIKDTVYHVQFPQQVNPKSTKRINFMTGINRDSFGGVLLYHLQRKEDILTSIQLLVIWGYKSNRLYSDVLLIEHENTFIRSKDKLKRLYDVYNSQYDRDFAIEGWLLDDSTKLKTKCEMSHGGFKMKVVISGERDQSQSQRPLWIDSNR